MQLGKPRHRGFSLPELVVALGLVAGISLITMKLVDEQRANAAFLKATSEINKTVAAMQGAINNAEACKDMFIRNTTYRSYQEEPTGSTNDVVVKLQKQVVVDGAITGAKVFLYTPNAAGLSFPDDRTDYGDFYLRYGDMRIVNTEVHLPTVAELLLRFRYNRRALSLWGERNSDSDAIIEKRIRFMVTLDTSVNPETTNAKITSCGPLVSDENIDSKKKFCESMGAATSWDADRSQCVLTSMDCPWGEVPLSMTEFGPPTCVDIRSVINLGDVFTTTTDSSCAGIKVSPKFQVQVDVGGKFVLKCLP